MAAARELQLRREDGADAADRADREVDLAQQKHEDDAVRDDRDAGHLHDQVVEVRRADVRRRLGVEENSDRNDPDDDRRTAKLPRPDVVPCPPRQVRWDRPLRWFRCQWPPQVLWPQPPPRLLPQDPLPLLLKFLQPRKVPNHG